jgi:hypothetical protein
VFFRADAWPVGLLFTGLALVYVAEFFASFKLGVKVGADGRESTNLGERALGLVHIVVGLWLMCCRGWTPAACWMGPTPSAAGPAARYARTAPRRGPPATSVQPGRRPPPASRWYPCGRSRRLSRRGCASSSPAPTSPPCRAGDGRKRSWWLAADHAGGLLQVSWETGVLLAGIIPT